MNMKINMKAIKKERLDYFVNGTIFIYAKNDEIENLYLKLDEENGVVKAYRFNDSKFIDLDASVKVRLAENVEINVGEWRGNVMEENIYEIELRRNVTEYKIILVQTK